MNHQPSFDEMRQTMIDCQLRPTGVSDPRVVEAFASVARERFVPADRTRLAYVDDDLQIAPGRHLMDPMAFGQLLMGAQFKPHERVLVIGAAGGYAAAVISRLVAEVVALESDGAMAADAAANLTAEGADNAKVVEGVLAEGWAAAAPYDAVYFDGAVAHVPPALLSQLKDGGRVVGVLIGEDGVQRGATGIVVGGSVGTSEFADISVRPLQGFDRPKQFTF